MSKPLKIDYFDTPQTTGSKREPSALQKTTGSTTGTDASAIRAIDPTAAPAYAAIRYGLGKPYRVIIKGKVVRG